MIRKLFFSFVGIVSFVSTSNAQFEICNTSETILELKLSLCAVVKTPLFHEPGKEETIDLFIRKFPAKEKREGSIWLIAGGPGESGASFYPLITKFKEIFPHLDIIVPDHRGTGASSKICPEQESLESANGIALANDEWGPCFGQMLGNIPYTQAFSITNAAKDLGILINNLSGEGKRYIYGVSYGTQLVLRLMQQNMVKVDGVLLDSLVPLQDDGDFDLSKRSQVTDKVGRMVLNSFDTINPKGVNLASRLEKLIERSQSDKKFAEQILGQNLSSILGMMLDIPDARNKLPSIIEGLEKNDFKVLNDVVQDITNFYKDYGSKYDTSPSSIPLVQIITASENNLRPGMKKVDVVEEAKGLLFSSPLPNLIAENTMPTYQCDQYFATIPQKMPPTVIFQGTLDPKTDYDGAVRHVKKLSKVGEVILVSVTDAPHFVALFAQNSFAKIAAEFIEGKSITQTIVNDEYVALKK
ncbi:alpha/beta fold hydrolase [Aquimarina algiphila]|uniref:alpha/beta fold hydrolase n=1 Tax=Aquimarina algiphila TaxID=2047982 RepID=UPI002490ED05|nr:alpha/beta fold hydrolase [Aquimarina algiphila]